MKLGGRQVPLSFGWTGATDENISEMSSEKFLKGLASNNSLRVFVKKDHQEILGFCATRMIDAKSIELAGIIIRQDCVGKGIGTALFELAKTKAVEAGYDTMFVKTESLNQQALFSLLF